MIPRSEAFWRTGSETLIVGTVIVWISWTFAAWWFGGPNTTISTVWSDAIEAHRGLFIVSLVAIGIVLGHWYWPGRTASEPSVVSVASK